jgi:beta-mannosidase
VGLAAEARLDADGAGAALLVRTRRFAQSIAVDVEGFEPEDAYFHLAPGEERLVRLRRTAGTGAPRGTLQPLNAEAATKITLAS